MFRVCDVPYRIAEKNRRQRAICAARVHLILEISRRVYGAPCVRPCVRACVCTRHHSNVLNVFRVPPHSQRHDDTQSPLLHTRSRTSVYREKNGTNLKTACVCVRQRLIKLASDNTLKYTCEFLLTFRSPFRPFFSALLTRCYVTPRNVISCFSRHVTII